MERRSKAMLAAFVAAFALLITGGIGIASAATTPTDSGDLTFAQRMLTNCQLALETAPDPAYAEEATRCINTQTRIIAALTAPSPTPSSTTSPAGTPTPSGPGTPTSSPSASPTSAVTPTPTATPTPSSTPSPTSSFPTEASTGYRDGGALTAGSCNLSTANAVYDHKVFDCSTTNWLAINASGVKITNSVVYVGLYGGVEVSTSVTGVRLEDTTVQAKGANPYAREAAISGSGFTLLRVRSYSGGDGIFVSGSNPIRVESSYIRQQPLAGSHSDGIQRYSGTPATALVGNTFIQDTASTAPIFWSGGPLTMTGNLLRGGGYSWRMGGASANGSIATGNVVARGSYSFGPTLFDQHGWGTFSGNVVADVDSAGTVTNATALVG